MIKIFASATIFCLLTVKISLAAVSGGPVFSDAYGNLTSQRGCVTLESYGGVSDGRTLNDNALQAAIATSNGFQPNHPCVKFGSGTYRFGSTFSYTVPFSGSITFAGESSQATKLQWAGSRNAIQLTQTTAANTTLSTFHLRNLTIATEGTTTSAIGLVLTGYGRLAAYPASDLIDVSFEGADGHTGQNFWGVAIYINGWSGINISKGHILNGGTIPSGTIGILMTGNSAQQPSVINIESLMIGYYDLGIQYGSYTQGVTINQTNILGCSYGLVVPGGQAGILSQLTYTNNQSNCTRAQVFIGTPVDPIQISSNLFESAAGTGNLGILLNTSRHSIITNNVFLGTGGTGLYVASSTAGAAQIASDNVFAGFGTAIALAGSTTGWTVHDNRLSGTGCVGCAANGNFEHDDH